MKTSGTYIPPSMPQIVFIIVAVPFPDKVLNVKKTLIIEMVDVMIAAISRASVNSKNDVKLVGNINLMLLGSKNATIVKGTQRINVAESL